MDQAVPGATPFSKECLSGHDTMYGNDNAARGNRFRKGFPFPYLAERFSIAVALSVR
jgi:hypothetical protein